MVRFYPVSPYCFFPLIVGLLLSSAACIPTKSARVAGVALTLQDVAQAAAKQTDATIIREGTPAYLMLVDGLIEAYPGNRDLLVAGCKAYASYASMFLSDDQSKEAEALYRKAKLYGFRALSDKGDFANTASGNLEEFRSFLQRYKKEDVPALFWTASAWGGWISSNLGNVEAVGDLPVFGATLDRVLELDDTYDYGGPHLLKGIYLAVRAPVLGGGLAEAKKQFECAFSINGNKVLAGRVLFAQYYAVGIKDRSLFEGTLREVLAVPVDEVPELTLANTLAKEKAKKLLAKTEVYFGG
jgi:hypothetical protein